MKASTRAVLVAVLHGDETVGTSLIEDVLAILDGRPISPSTQPGLVTKSAAAAKIGISRTLLWSIIAKERDKPDAEKRFPEVEISPNVFRLRVRDVDAFINTWRARGRWTPDR